MDVTAFDLAQRFIGLREVPGVAANHAILAMLRLDDEWPEGDEVAWCSAFCNYIAWLLRLPRSKSLRARSWLLVGREVIHMDAEAGFDVVVLNRADGPTDPRIIKAPGHVGFFAGWRDREELHNGAFRSRAEVLVLGGNQGNAVNVSSYPRDDVLGIRRLAA